MKLKQKVKNLGIASLIFLNSYASLVGCNSNVTFQDASQISKQQEVQKNNEASKNPAKKLEELVSSQTQQPAQTLKPIRMNQIPVNVLTVGGQGLYQSIVDGVNHAPEGYDVWVSEGRYFESESVHLRKNVRLLGGFSKDFSKRDFKQFLTIIDGNGVYKLPCVMLGETSTVDGFVIQDCNSLDASGIEIGQSEGGSSEFTITHNVIKNNKAGEDGEAAGIGVYIFFNANAKLNISGNEIHGNVGGRGTGVYLNVNGGADGRNLTAILDAIIEGNEIYSNTNQSAGAGIHATISNYAQANIVIRNNKIRGNQSGMGGGVYVTAQNPESQLNLVIENNDITENKVDTSGTGGGIEINSLSELLTATIKGNIINKNQSGFIGGGLYISTFSVNPALIEISGNVISSNTAGSWGGGVYIEGNVNSKIFNNLISYNTAVGNLVNDAVGGGVYVKDGGLISLVNNTVYGNKAVGQKPHAGGVYVHSLSSSPVVVKNSIIRGNSLQGTYPGFGADFYAGSSVVASYSSVGDVSFYDGKWGEPDGSFTSSNMVNVDPVFDNLESFVLSDNSPMIDAGDPLILDECSPPGKGTGRSDISNYAGENCNVRMAIVKGDINGDGYLDLKDEVLANQVLSGMRPTGIRPDYATSGADVDGDGKISMIESIYILQKKAGMR